MMLHLLGRYMSASYNVRRFVNASGDFDALSMSFLNHSTT